MRVTIKDHANIVSKVYLNDEEVKGCFEADDEEGYIIRYKKDDNDNYILIFDDNGEQIAAHEKIEGNVRIELK